jgi:hypothetical protein
LQQCYSKPGSTRVTLVENGVLLLVGRREDGGASDVDPRWFDIVADLAVAQEKLLQPILIPADAFTREEQQVVAKLRSLLRDPEFGGTWNHIEVGIAAKDAKTQLERFLQGEQGSLHQTMEERAELAGVEFSLGRVLYMFESARLANEPEVLEQVAHAKSIDVEIKVRFEPGNTDMVVMRYLDWLEEPNEFDTEPQAN